MTQSQSPYLEIFSSKVSVDTLIYLDLELAYVSELRRQFRALPVPPAPPNNGSATALGFYYTVREPQETPIVTAAAHSLHRIEKTLESMTAVHTAEEWDKIRQVLDRLGAAFAEMHLRLDQGKIIHRLQSIL